MRDTLAEMVLARVIDWDAEKLSKERLDLELLAGLKYDEYGQFLPGMRFIESLSLWLGQFDKDERCLMYNFIKKRLVFISNAEMQHYIRMAYADHVKPILIAEAARRAGIPEEHIAKVTASREFAALKRKCLYLGLSDGSRMDDFRRFSSLDHEQVYPTYEIASTRKSKMLESLAKSLECAKAKFEIVFLVDDFSASGISYLREANGKFGGKINKFLQQFSSHDRDDRNSASDDRPKHNGFDDMFTKDLLVVVLLYVGTDKAVDHIKQLTSKLFKKHSVRVEVVVVHEIHEATVTAMSEMTTVSPILEKQFDDAVATADYKKGKHKMPYLGFDECGLVLVLSHNCPNNTLPIVWHESKDHKIRALFPRHQRFAGG